MEHFCVKLHRLGDIVWKNKQTDKEWRKPYRTQATWVGVIRPASLG